MHPSFHLLLTLVSRCLKNALAFVVALATATMDVGLLVSYVTQPRLGRLSISTHAPHTTGHTAVPLSAAPTPAPATAPASLSLSLAGAPGTATASTWPPTSPISRETPYAFRAPSASEIFPRLYVSDLAFAENPALLRSLGITHVLSAMCGHVAIPRSILVQHVKCDLEDLPFAELVDKLPGTTTFLRDALRDPSARVLVHCVEGVSRSTSVVCAYLIAEYGYSPAQAIQYVKSRRRSAEPNFGFVQQLHEYAAKLPR